MENNVYIFEEDIPESVKKKVEKENQHYNFSACKRDFKHGHSTDAGGQRLQGLVLQKSLRRRKGKSIMVAGVPRAKLQDADAHGNPLG